MKYEFSAGGVVLTTHEGKLHVLLAQHSYHHGWVFPKGLIGDRIANETQEETALREVQEETGALGTIVTPLSPISYWYMFEGEKRKKTVHYFIMKYTKGDITKHDHEMEQVEWVAYENVATKLTYPSDKKVWEEAKQYIETHHGEVA